MKRSFSASFYLRFSFKKVDIKKIGCWRKRRHRRRDEAACDVGIGNAQAYRPVSSRRLGILDNFTYIKTSFRGTAVAFPDFIVFGIQAEGRRKFPQRFFIFHQYEFSFAFQDFDPEIGRQTG